MIDLRSDTVTRPTPAMYDAMAKAKLGDDVFGDDPTTNELEERTASLLGFEAGLFVSSGTQSNFLGVITHCGRGEEVILGRANHIYSSEAVGSAVLGGVAPCPLENKPDGTVDPAVIEGAIKPDDPHSPISKLICMENTWHGRVIPLEYQQEVQAIAKKHGLATHLDGARMMNAAVKLGVEPRAVAAGFDSLSLCLSKGLGAPVGSVLCGPKDFIKRARRLRKMAGGGMRQTGLLAACGLVALDQHIDRMTEDHANAKRLAEGLAQIPGIEIDMESVQTNMVLLSAPHESMDAMIDFMESRDILVCETYGKLRLVTHLDVSAQDVETVIAAFKDFYSQSAAAQ